MTWPQISFVAEDNKGRIVGYVLAKMFVAMNIQEKNPTHLSPAKNLQRTTKVQKITDISSRYQYSDHIDGWDWLKS